jgi:hypothetical protein
MLCHAWMELATLARVLTRYPKLKAISDAISVVNILQESDIARYHGMLFI